MFPPIIPRDTYSEDKDGAREPGDGLEIGLETGGDRPGDRHGDRPGGYLLISS